MNCRSVPAALGWLLCLTLVLGGCSPAYNWRELRAPAAPLVALMPCKPDSAERLVPMFGPEQPPVPLTLWSCEAQGIRFALAAAPVPDGMPSEQVMQQWRRAAWSALRLAIPEGNASPAGWQVQVQPFAGVSDASQAWGAGLDHRGSGLHTHLAWAINRGWLVQAAIYSPRSEPELADTFLSGVRFVQ